MRLARQITGWTALVVYLVMGALNWFVIVPGAGGHYPPDFHALGYDVVSIAPFVENLSDTASDSYLMLLTMWDRVFVVALAAWIALVGWRGGPLRFAVAGLAVLYGLIDLSENAAVHRFVFELGLNPQAVAAASSLTMAKFASLYLAGLALLAHVRRERSR